MKPDDLLDAIGNVDDLCVSRAGEKREQKTARKQTGKKTQIFVPLAACAALTLALILPFIRNFDRNTPENPREPSQESSQYVMETAVLWDNIWIYYVEGTELNREQEYLPMSTEEIFDAWKEKNGIGDDVPFIRVQIDSNGREVEPEDGMEGVVVYQIGDYFIYNLTVSKNLGAYYDTIDEELLLESLRRTMTGYNSIEYDEYHLFLE